MTWISLHFDLSENNWSVNLKLLTKQYTYVFWRHTMRFSMPLPPAVQNTRCFSVDEDFVIPSMCLCVSVCIGINMSVRVSICVCINMCLCLCVSVCFYYCVLGGLSWDKEHFLSKDETIIWIPNITLCSSETRGPDPSPLLLLGLSS